MYLPSHFEETRTEVLHHLVRAHPLGVLVTLGSDGLNANHLPFEIDPEPAPLGTLRGHVSRSNPVWRDVTAGLEALVVFQGPQAYVTPAWYETKRVSGKVVPTYNYAVVHAYGPLRAVEDRAWLRGFVERLTGRFEAGRTDPWQVADAPDDYIERQLGGIVGLELPIRRLLGKWKVSQNRPESDRAGVVRGLRETGDPGARAIADLIEARDRPSPGARPDFEITRDSRPVVISSYQPHWADDFRRIARHIRALVGRSAMRIDHIGSTAVPGLGAKDVIDLQITVSDLDGADRLTDVLRAAGFRQGTTFAYDLFHGKPETDPELRKRFMREPEGQRRAHLHIRELGRFNQRYALLFRDYLRASETVRAEYELVKRRAAQLFPDDIDGYLRLKDPVLHIIHDAASLWAEKVGWGPDEDYS